MTAIRTALAASVVARGWATLVGVLAVPAYVYLLGLEAYGVIGFFASVQAVIAFMEFGLPATLTRELASERSPHPARAHPRDVALSFELAYLGMTLVVTLASTAVAPLLAAYWVNAAHLSTDGLSHALVLAGVALACQWPSNLYSAGLLGLHRQTALAVSTSALAVVRVVLTLTVLWWYPTLVGFFWAQIASALIQSLVTRYQFWKALPLAPHRPVVQWQILSATRRFAGGMTAISVTTIILTQADKLVLSYLLPLSDFGVYTLASTAAAGLYVLISPMFSVVYPQFSRLWASRDLAELEKMYQVAGQAMAAMVIPAAAVIAVFPAQVLQVWTGNVQIGQEGALALSFLVIGCALNGLMNIPYALQLAAGWASLSVYINLGAIALLVPATVWGVHHYGAPGGAAAWCALNIGCAVLTPHLIHRRLLKTAYARWSVHAVVIPVAAGAAISAILWCTHQPSSSRVWTGGQLIGYWLIVMVCTTLSMAQLRERVFAAIRQQPWWRRLSQRLG